MTVLWPERSVWGVDPFWEFRRLQRDVNRLFRGYDGGAEAFPAVNVYSKGDEVLVTAELPGTSREDIHLSVTGNQLTIDGDRKPDEPAKDVVCQRRERTDGRFVRTIRLPYEVEEGKVSAKYKDGILNITLPRAEASKPRKIEIAVS